MNPPTQFRRSPESPPILTFGPLAWLKLQFFCHAGPTEIGGFGVSARKNLLYIEDFETVRQRATPMTVSFADAAVADWFDRCVDRGLTPTQCGRIWLHTHPGDSVLPSATDEQTFARVFGHCDWSLMFILGRTGNTYARLAFAAGPGGSQLLPVQVDWSSWPEVLAAAPETMSEVFAQWQQEYTANIEVLPDLCPVPIPIAKTAPQRDRDGWEREPPWPAEWDEAFPFLLENDPHHEPAF